MTPLRQRMIEDMHLRNLRRRPQRSYVHYVAGLAQFYQTSPEHRPGSHPPVSSSISPTSASSPPNPSTLSSPPSSSCIRSPWNCLGRKMTSPRARPDEKLPVVLGPRGDPTLPRATSTASSTAPPCSPATAPACASPRPSPSKSPISTCHACSSGSSTAKAGKTVTPCSPRRLLEVLRACFRTLRRQPPDGCFPRLASDAASERRRSCRPPAARPASSGLAKRVTVHTSAP